MPQDQVRQVTLNVDLGYAKSILGICKVLEFVSCQSILSQGFPLSPPPPLGAIAHVVIIIEE